MKIKINIPTINLLTKTANGIFVGKNYKENEEVDVADLAEQEVVTYLNHFLESKNGQGLSWISKIEETVDKTGVTFGLEQQPANIPVSTPAPTPTSIVSDATKNK